MGYRKQLISSVNSFYFDCMEEFREAEAKINNDSKFRRIFAQKDYVGNVKLLRNCKKRAQSIRFPVASVPEDDQESIDLLLHCENSILLFNKLCDAYIQLQLALQEKSEGRDLSYKEYMQIYNRAKEYHGNLNRHVQELDILYADYTEDLEDHEYLTYDMLKEGEEKS